MQLLLRLFKQFWASKGSNFGEGVDWLKATLKRSCASPRLLGRQENNSLIKRHAECRCERRCDVSLTCKKKSHGKDPKSWQQQWVIIPHGFAEHKVVVKTIATNSGSCRKERHSIKYVYLLYKIFI